MATTGNDSGPPVRERIGERVTIFRRGETWWAEYYAAKTQQRISLKTNNLKRARQAAQRIDVSLQDGTFRAPQKVPLLSELAQLYLDYLKVEGRAASTLKRYRPELERLVEFAARHGAERADELTVRILDLFRAARVQAGVEPATVYHESTLAKQLLNFAVERDFMPANPLKKLKLKKPSQGLQPSYTLAQVEAIITGTKGQWAEVYEFLACTGLRIGELCWLTWADIDETGGFVQVREKPGWKPKDRDDRRIPINDRLQRLLKRLPRSPGWVFKGKPCKKHPKGGQQISARRALSALNRALDTLEIADGNLHTFRSFFITHCLLQGVSPYVVAEWVGHSSLQMVMKYFRMLKNESRQAMVKVSFTPTPAASGAAAVVNPAGKPAAVAPPEAPAGAEAG